jgi:hypothetical protein
MPNMTPDILARMFWYAAAQLLRRDPTGEISKAVIAIGRAVPETLFDIETLSKVIANGDEQPHVDLKVKVLQLEPPEPQRGLF